MEKLDKKFYTATGTTDRQAHIYKAKNDEVVEDDSWVLFLAKDNAFAATLPTYLENCKELGADSTQIKMVEEMIERVTVWRAAHPDLCKVPDATGEQVLP